MNRKQFDLIAGRRFKTVSPHKLKACEDVVLNGVSAYRAEITHSQPPKTVSRLVNRINDEYDWAREVASYD